MKENRDPKRGSDLFQVIPQVNGKNGFQSLVRKIPEPTFSLAYSTPTLQMLLRGGISYKACMNVHQAERTWTQSTL